MLKKCNQILSLSFFFLVFILTCFYIFKDVSIPSLIQTIFSVNPIYIFIGFVMMLIFIICEALKLFIILKQLKHPISINQAINYALVGFYFSSITPSTTGGQPAQMYYMSKDNIQVSKSSLTLLMTTIIYQTMTIFYGLFLFVFNYSFVIQHLGHLKYLLFISIAINLSMILILMLLMFSKSLIKKIFSISLNMLHWMKLIKHKEKTQLTLDCVMSDYTKGASYIKSQPALVCKTTLVTLIQMTALYLIPFFVYKSFDLSFATLLQILTLQALLSLAVSSLPLPGSMGVTENGFLILFRLFFANHLLIPAMLLSRLFSFYGVFIISGIVTVVLSFVVHQKKPRSN